MSGRAPRSGDDRSVDAVTIVSMTEHSTPKRATAEWAELEAVLQYAFHERRWVEQAFTHKSSLNEPKGLGSSHANERLEFLGDAVLNLVVSEELIHRHPTADEGTLSKMRAWLVSEAALADVARRLELGRFLRLGRGEELSGGREKHSLLADVFEALVAAVYQDGGYGAVRACVLTVMAPELDELPVKGPGTDYKTQLQEYCQRLFGRLPVYRVSRETGPDHQKSFQVELTIKDQPYGVGTGRSKKEAEQQAAKAAWDRLQHETA
jgi:ribonuclease-3